MLVVCLGLICAGSGRVHAQSKISFQDVTQGSGIDTTISGFGVSTVDFNADGFDDITIARRDAPPAVLQNNGDATFTDVTRQLGITSTGNMIAVVWIDANRDGLPDLFIGHSDLGQSSLWLNQGDGTFKDVAESWGLDVKARVGAVSFGDFSGDGYPDLFLAVESGFDLLYLNDGGKGFLDVTDQYGVAGEPFSIPMQATWIDVDEDGDRDLFVTHDEFEPNFLYINEGGPPFVDRAEEWGIREVGAGNSMGVAWGDPDMDGDMDAYVTRIGVAGLYVYDQRIDRFVDQATQWRVALNGVGWGTYFVDLDNDMDEDLPLVHSVPAGFPPPILFENQRVWFDPIYEAGDFQFERSDIGLAVGDFDADGRQDLVVINQRGAHRLLLNQTSDTGNWLTIRLWEPDSYPAAIGSRLELKVGSETLIRVLHAGDGYNGQNTYRIPFGLDSETVADTLRVRWPDGEWETFTNLSAGERYVVTRGAIGTSLEGAPRVAPLPDEDSLVAIWPKPASRIVNVRSQGLRAGSVSVQVTDMLGRIIFREVMTSSGVVEKRLSVEGFLPGMYTVRISDGINVHRGLIIRSP